MRLLPLLLALAALALLAPAAHAQTTVPAGFQVKTTSDGYMQPVAMAHAADGRIFTAEKEGRVYVARKDGTLERTLVLDISAKVNSESDRGLLGIAVDKAFTTNGFVYLLYAYELNPMTPDSDGRMVSRLTRIKVNPDNTLENPSAPETVILGTYSSGPCPAANNAVDCIPADFHWHTIGTVRVDPVDGTLWLGSGDTTSGATQAQALRAQDERSFAGKIIHIDRTGKGLPGHKFCPAETDLTKVCTKIHAKGFRNPFRFALRPNKTPVIGDVGYDLAEEINLAKPGHNYGWPCYEGTLRPAGYAEFDACKALYAKQGTAEGVTFPDYSYPHENGASINGGPQYTGSLYPAEYRNDIFFGDYVRGWIKRLNVDANDNVLGVEPFAENLPAFVDLAVDPDGRLSFVDVGTFEPYSGGIRRFDMAGDLDPTARASATPTSGATAPLTVQFNGSTSSDPEGKALTYSWSFGDGATSTAANPSHTYKVDGMYTARLTVRDPGGQTGTAAVTIAVGNTPPTASIVAPKGFDTYITGNTVQLEAQASDAQDGTLAGSSLSWQILLHHGTHIHPHATATGATASFATDPGHDADAFYEIRLTATDSTGLTTRKSVVIEPKKVSFTLSSSPPGAPVGYMGGTMAPAPKRVIAAAGFKPSVAAAESFVRNGRTYRFKGWSDGGARLHEATVPANDGGLLAQYEADGLKTFTFTPTADAWVEAAAPDTNHGTGGELVVDASPERKLLMKFDVRGLEGGKVVGARLALHTTGASEAGGRVVKTVGGWSETGVTWNNKPSFSTIRRGLLGAVRTGEWTEVPLSAAVAGEGILSLGMDSASEDSAYYASRHTPNAARLTVEVEPVPTETLRFTPTADTYVSKATPSTSYGAGQTLITDADPARTIYMRFNVTGLAGRPIYASKLRLHQTDTSPVGGRVMQMGSTTWSEGVTFNSRPPIWPAELGAFGAVTPGNWYTAPLRSGVKGEGPVSFAITTSSGDSSQWASRESANRPELLVVVPAAAAPAR